MRTLITLFSYCLLSVNVQVNIWFYSKIKKKCFIYYKFVPNTFAFKYKLIWVNVYDYVNPFYRFICIIAINLRYLWSFKFTKFYRMCLIKDNRFKKIVLWIFWFSFSFKIGTNIISFSRLPVWHSKQNEYYDYN